LFVVNDSHQQPPQQQQQQQQQQTKTQQHQNEEVPNPNSDYQPTTIIMSLGSSIKACIQLTYAFIGINIGVLFQLISLFTVRPFSHRLHLRWCNFLQDTFLSQAVYFLEREPNISIELTGDEVPPNENALLIPNHLNHDYGPLYCFAFRKNMLGNVRTILKVLFKFLPGFGWSMYLNGWPFVERDWNKDEKKLKRLFKLFKDYHLPLWLWLFPEGTRFTTQKWKESQEYCQKNGYPIYKHVLLPRPKGFHAALVGLEGVIDYVYDITLNYTGWKHPPGPLDLINLDPKKNYIYHIHVRRVPVASIPKDPEGTKKWLLECFEEKDKLLEIFHQTGHFPGTKRDHSVPKEKFLFPLVMWFSLVVLAVSLPFVFFFFL